MPKTTSMVDSPADRNRRSARVAISEAWPEVPLAVPLADRALAERILIVPLLRERNEDLGAVIAGSPGAFCFVVMEGAVLKQTTLMGRVALELLGPGDLLVPPLSAARQIDAIAVSRYLAHGEVHLAPIDGTFRQSARRWPGLADLLHDRLAQQTHRASTHSAMLQLPRVEDRLLALFTTLANRYGRVRGGGVDVALPLTHEVLGQLVGSRRSTVTLALRTLAEARQIERLENGTWQLDLRLVTD